MSAPLPWNESYPLANPPLICEACGEEIPDGAAHLSAEEHLICGFCSVEFTSFVCRDCLTRQSGDGGRRRGRSNE